MQPLYSNLEVNNEIELCEVYDIQCKERIERELLKNRISYYIRWPKPGLFGRRKHTCIICVNSIIREDAENAIRTACEGSGYEVKFFTKKQAVHL